MKKKEYFYNILTESWNSLSKDDKEDKSINDLKIVR